MSIYEKYVQNVTFLPSNNGKYLSQCKHGFEAGKQCHFQLAFYRQINIFDVDCVRILKYPVIKCIKHAPRIPIDPYYPNSSEIEIYLNKNEWLNGIDFYIGHTNKTLNRKNIIKCNRYTFKLIQYLWRMIWKGIIKLFSFQFNCFHFNSFGFFSFYFCCLYR